MVLKRPNLFFSRRKSGDTARYPILRIDFSYLDCCHLDFSYLDLKVRDTGTPTSSVRRHTHQPTSLLWVFLLTRTKLGCTFLSKSAHAAPCSTLPQVAQLKIRQHLTSHPHNLEGLRVALLADNHHDASASSKRRHTAGRLAEQGATVLVHGRRETAVQEAVEFVKEQQREGSAGKVEGFVADVSSFEGMHKLCDEVLAKTARLDCVINNAGVRCLTDTVPFSDYVCV